MELSYMATLPRHGNLVSSFFGRIFSYFEKGQLYALQEQHPLVFINRKYSGEEKLVDVKSIDDMDKFRKVTIDELDFVQPDFFMFVKGNVFVQSLNTIKTAGQPDLVVEIWSGSNTREERDMRRRVYSSSGKTEHWYIEQDSNIVECWQGSIRLENQTLTKVLKMKEHDIEFDLRFLAL